MFFPNLPSLIRIKFTPTLPTILEEKDMPKPSFTLSTNNNWFVPIISNNEQLPTRLSFTPSACNWLSHDEEVYESDLDNIHNDTQLACNCSLYDFQHNETQHYQEDTSFFPDVYGNIVKYGQADPIYENFKSCMKCDNVQDNNILLQCCSNNHYLCTDCFYQEKRCSQRQNVEYERQKRYGLKPNEIQVLKYQFICPECNTEETLNFSVLHENLFSSEDIEIISAMKKYK